MVVWVCCALVAVPAISSTPRSADAEAWLVIEIDGESSFLSSLGDAARDTDWLSQPCPLFDLGPHSSLQPRLTVERLSDTQVELTLALHNPTDQPIEADVRFPVLSGLGGPGTAEDLAYCYPRQDLILGTDPIELDEPYSSRFPLQFLAAYRPGKGGVYLLTCDTEMLRKRYFLRKDSEITMGTSYPGLVVGPGETFTLPTARIGLCEGDWHDAFDAYRRWVATWYTPAVARKDWFRRVFNFRQVFLYPNLDTPGLYDPETQSFAFQQAIAQDVEQFGGIDYLHIFDWSQTPDQGRVGEYAPWGYLPKANFVRALREIQEQDIPVGLYFEGYLVSPAATLPGRPGRAWQLRNAEGGRYDPFGSGDDYLCPGVIPWLEHLGRAVVGASQQIAADGYYIDQFGFGYQYPCFDPTHGHATPSNQVRLETELIARVRRQLPEDQILYTEQTPVDMTMQYQDGSFSYSLLHARHRACPSRTSLTRFAFPDFKTIQILRGDGPIGTDALGVKLVFFNGDGLWLVGPSDNPNWYSIEVLEAIRKTHQIKRQYADAFSSNDAAPLVPTLIPDVYANRFQGTAATVWTLFNAGNQTLDAPAIRVDHVEGARYYDAWNQKEVYPTIENGVAIVSLEMQAEDVGCLIQINGD